MATRYLILHAYGDSIDKALFLTTTRISFSSSKDLELFLLRVRQIIGNKVKIESIVKIIECVEEYETLQFPLSDPEKLAVDIFTLK